MDLLVRSDLQGSQYIPPHRQLSFVRTINDGNADQNYDTISSRNTVATIMQVQTENCGLKNAPYSECGYGKEIMEHYIQECRKYNEQGRNTPKDSKTRKHDGRDIAEAPTNVEAHDGTY